MGKSSIFQRFIKALKMHWRSALPQVKPLAERVGRLPKASSFDAGIIAETEQHVYLGFQTNWKEAGYFTINLVVVDEGQEPSLLTIVNRGKSRERLEHGGHRIGHFIGERRDDKWWHLCAIKNYIPRGIDRQYWLELEMRLREGNWTAANYEDEEQVIAGAVADVTRDVENALKAIGVRMIGGGI